MAASSRPDASELRPLSVAELSKKAEAFEFNPHIPLKYWLRTADTLLREADIYEAEGNDQQAYLLLMRYATLVVDKLPRHPSASAPEFKRQLKTTQKALTRAVVHLEALRPEIEQRYEHWIATEKRRAKPAGNNRNSASRRSVDLSASDPALPGHRNALSATEHSDLALKLAHDEFRRRVAVRRATRQAGISPEEERERRTGGVWAGWEAHGPSREQPNEEDAIQQRMIDARRRLDGARDIPPARPAGAFQQHSIQTSGNYKYPTITKSQPVVYEERKHHVAKHPANPPSVPPKPPKDRYDSITPELYNETELPELPELPGKTPLDASPAPAAIANDSTKSSFTFKPSAYLENGTPLRTIFLPANLRETFLAYAAKNTRQNLETCGILCGTLISNALFISRLVIPEQESTSDTCETVNEGALFEYCDSEDLMVLGWIHTHPTQTCFMSSRDLHTHCGYQVMMPESIAIVCAPSKDPSWGIFRLTDPPGMQAVLQCKQTGIFHPHPEPNIYTDALRPGHVYEAKGLQFEVVDLRP